METNTLHERVNQVTRPVLSLRQAGIGAARSIDRAFVILPRRRYLMKQKSKTCTLALLVGSAVLANAASASAATVDCTNPTLVPHPVYIAGANAVTGYLEGLAGLLGSTVSLIYAGPSSCQGIGDVLTVGQAESTTTFALVTSTGTTNCSGPPTDGGFQPYPSSIYVDIGVSDVYASTCITPAFPTLPAGFNDFTGAIQPFVIAVPWASSQFSINADAAYVVFGFGGGSYLGTTYTVGPWTETADIFTRGDSAGVQLMIADAIGLPGNKWLSALGADASAGQIIPKNSILLTDVLSAGATAADATIGILGSASVDPLKSATGGLKPLAFQGIDQECAYYPDSTLSAFDKINVRQGRYAIWGPEHFFAAVDGSNNPQPNANGSSNPLQSAAADVQKVINIVSHNPAVITQTSTPSLLSVITAETAAYYVPTCAMQVSRTTEVGPESSYYPPIAGTACGCFYESQLHGGGGNLSSYCTSCTAATVATDCTNKNYPVCNFGYCEAK
jgi:hypothetical protein